VRKALKNKAMDFERHAKSAKVWECGELTMTKR
jgi:hypothetical protein